MANSYATRHYSKVMLFLSISGFTFLNQACVCLQDKMLSMAVANHVLWPLAKFVNAKLVPKQHQPVANKVVQVSSQSRLSSCRATS